MDIILLGLLMLQKCTVYEMRKYIDLCFSSISSNSMGSIQSAIKKLLARNMITFNEFVENSVNKKVYEITDAGKQRFYATISSPMQYKDKNMELSKLFFMGFTAKENWDGLIDAYINVLRDEQTALESIRTNIDSNPEIDEAYVDGFKQNSSIPFEDYPDPVAYVKGIGFFQVATLSLSIDKLQFEIEWFERLKDTLKKERQL